MQKEGYLKGKNGSYIEIVDKKAREGLSTNDYTNADKAKVDAIPANPKYTDTVYNDDGVRSLISDLTDRLNAVADSDDETLDQLHEIVAYIKSNRGLIDAITTAKISYTDIIDGLTSEASDKPLSAKQGKILKELIDAIVVPTKISDLTDDSKFIKDIQCNYKSIVGANKVATLPNATDTSPGVIIYDPKSFEIGKYVPILSIKDTTVDAIKNVGFETTTNMAVTVKMIREAIFYGLAALAGDTTQRTSSNPVGTYTAEAKQAIKTMLGL